jgi:uracil-DNA glycosylase
VNNDILYGEIDVTPTIHPNRLMRNEYNYKFTEIHLN